MFYNIFLNKNNIEFHVLNTCKSLLKIKSRKLETHITITTTITMDASQSFSPTTTSRGFESISKWYYMNWLGANTLHWFASVLNSWTDRKESKALYFWSNYRTRLSYGWVHHTILKYDYVCIQKMFNLHAEAKTKAS